MTKNTLEKDSESVRKLLAGAMLKSRGIEKLVKGGGLLEENIFVTGLSGTPLSILFALVKEYQKSPILYIAENEQKAELVLEDLFSLGFEKSVRYLPYWEIKIPTPQSPDLETTGSIIEALYSLIRGQNDIILATSKSIQMRVPSRSLLETGIIRIHNKQNIELDFLSGSLCRLGYEKVNMVQELGEWSLRGGILDVFSFGLENPVRLDFWGDEVESIRIFDPRTQRSLENVEEVHILPRRLYPLVPEKDNSKKDVGVWTGSSGAEYIAKRLRDNPFFEGYEAFAALIHKKLETIFDFLPENIVIFFEEPGCLFVEENIEKYKFLSEIKKSCKDTENAGLLGDAVSGLFIEIVELRSLLYSRKCIYHSAFQEFYESDFGIGERFKFEFRPSPPVKGKIQELLNLVRQLTKEQQCSVIIFCDTDAQKQRYLEILDEMEAQVILVPGNISSGFIFREGRLAVLTDHEIFQRYMRKKIRREFKGGGSFISSVSALHTGDYVVHMDHGVGIYRGLKRLELDGRTTDCLEISYSEGDLLYVPIHQLSLLQKYRAGVSEESPVKKLDRIGGTNWEKIKNRTKKAIREMASELLNLYARRKHSPGYKFDKDSEWQNELEAAFPYEETVDQLKACLDTKHDMELPVPMDRLICGDVGFGKTEVAIRAAFKAIMNGKQVAILVPTTVLAQQHYNTFSERLKPYPAKVEMLSRFKSAADQKTIIQGIKDNQVDLVVGTHRLLSKDVEFHDLGLLIVDEEQRFGVAHKEKIKRLKVEVDVLTMTATPIPRTFHMSLLGIRDMSLINTPPHDRLPISTEIHEFNGKLIREVCLREIERGGQVFFVHNRVRSINSVALFVQELLPKARIAVAHGQLRERELESIMLNFLKGRFDILVTTMIIESGLDMPNVNTILINRADKFGLAQLYQLRGRVGRSHKKAYAYLLVPPQKRLTDIAKKRLRVIRDYSDLGSGYYIAMEDLEIRGCGNVLGPEQHGFIATVGFETYTKLLEETIQELKGIPQEELEETRIKIHAEAFIDEEYVTDAAERISIYKRLSQFREIESIAGIEQELVDRFGRLPEPALNLLKIKKCAILGKTLKVEEINITKYGVELQFFESFTPGRNFIEKVVEQFHKRIEFMQRGGFGIRFHFTGRLDKLDESLLVLQKLTEIISQIRDENTNKFTLGVAK